MPLTNLKKGVPIILWFLILLFSLTSCSGTLTTTRTKEKSASCPIVPTAFDETDIIGTWVAEYGINQVDILIIRNDGTYKQIYETDTSRYESAWQRWWLEYRDGRYYRLHLEGMRRCDDILSICNRVGGGINPTEYTAIDYCENDVIEMPNEVVLIVTGTSYETIRNIILRQARLSGSNWTWSFSFKE